MVALYVITINFRLGLLVINLIYSLLCTQSVFLVVSLDAIWLIMFFLGQLPIRGNKMETQLLKQINLVYSSK